jgi:anti-sigma28 factor (negative regulator of flagellin synthesis)
MSKIQDDYATGNFAPQGQNTNGLKARIAASHAGIVTRNNGFYLPAKMRVGASTFTENYNKPVLLHHEDHADPVGRVVHSTYVDTSHKVMDKYIGLQIKDSADREVGVINDALYKDFVDGKLPFGQQVDLVRSLFRRDSKIFDSSSYDGVGYVEIVANVTDPAAIQKLLDGRYVTGSVGATTNKAVCSICKQDWTDSGACEHRPGAVYDEGKCFLIAGDLFYDEYSFVNVPADRHSKVLELHYNGTVSTVDAVDEYAIRPYEVQLTFPDYESGNEESFMLADSLKTPEEDKQVVDNAESKVQDETTTDTEAETKVADSADEHVADDTSVEDSTDVEDDTSGEDVEDASDPISELIVKVLDEEGSLTDEEEELLYDALWDEVKAAVEDGELELDAELLSDAKLSTKQRKKLAKSTFCGPGRSFPVPDCAHVTAARRLIGRAKVSAATKQRILACVSRKAKALGCGGSSKKMKNEAVSSTNDSVTMDNLHAVRLMQRLLSVIEEDEFVPSQDQKLLSADDVKQLQTLLKKLSTVVGKDSLTEAIVNEQLAVHPDCEAALLDEVTKNEETIGDLRDQLSALRKEYTALYTDLELLQDSLIEEKTAKRALLQDQAALLMSLRDGKQKTVEDVSALSDEALASEVVRLKDEVDMVAITDKLSDGMSRIPEDTKIDDPTVADYEKSSTTEDNSEIKISDELMKTLEFNYNKILFTRGAEAAARYVQEVKNSLKNNK